MASAWIATSVAWMTLFGSVCYLVSYMRTMRAEDVWRTLALIFLAVPLGPGLTLVLLYVTPTLVRS